MGRELKRVPLDFDYPLHKVWYGYFVDNISFCISSQNEEYCENCKEFARRSEEHTSELQSHA